MRELISTSKKKKKAQAGNEWSNILPKIFASEEKATITTTNPPRPVNISGSPQNLRDSERKSGTQTKTQTDGQAGEQAGRQTGRQRQGFGYLADFYVLSIAVDHLRTERERELVS